MSLATGQPAPLFALSDQDGHRQLLANYRGGWVLLYFYPKDDTPGCTKEACGFRDTWDEFAEAGIIVFGISADTEASHKKFADKHDLPFSLLVDTDGELSQEYGVWIQKKMFGKTFMGVKRVSFLINPAGEIAKIYPKVKPDQHAAEVLQDVAELSKN